MKNIIALLLINTLCSPLFVAAAAGEAPQGAGAEMYRKRCSACHPDPARFKATEHIIDLMRTPPAPMPEFSEGKISRNEATAIADFIRPLAAPGNQFQWNWTIKESRDGEVTSIQKFALALNANNELTVIPSGKLVDRAVAISVVEIADKTLKLKLKCKTKVANSYWKIDTYDLSISDYGTRSSGSYNLKSADGRNAVQIAWGE